ncbi:hypothetical protein [Steroidobacter cummioxidans]|uniref:hypothetical protein n=1 Tax=Steroidobacter cummioxidans TaxID=1803913 RepID=UPI00137A38C9|nr:hypothetical protein [Steroidobacter cummioxidans]
MLSRSLGLASQVVSRRAPPLLSRFPDSPLLVLQAASRPEAAFYLESADLQAASR